MSSWDAPTGNWDSRREPDESGGPDEQGYQQGESTGGYRAMHSGEGRPRAGRRGLPGYEQAQNHDQATSGYDQGPAYGQEAGYGQQSGYSSAPAYGQDAGAQMVRYGQRPAEDPAFGPGTPGSYSSDPLSAPTSGPRGHVGNDEEPTAAYGRYGGGEPARSGWSDSDHQPGYGNPPGYADQPGYADPPGYGDPLGYRSPAQDYGQGQPPADHGYRADQGYADQGYRAQPGYGSQDYRQNGYDQPGYGSASGPSDYPQNAVGDGGFGQSGFGQSGYGQDAYAQNGYAQDAYARDAYTQNAYGQNGYPQNGYGQDAYGQDAYAQGAYAQDAYGQAGYAPDGYGQPGFEAPPGSGFGDDGLVAPGPPGSRSGPRSAARSPQRPSVVRTVLYLSAAVIGVAAIVYLVVHITKSSGSSAASGTSTPSATSPAAAGYTIKVVSNVGKYPLNKQAVSEVSVAMKRPAASITNKLASTGAGKPTKSVVGIYNMGATSSLASANYKGMIFVGYDGTFNPANVIKLVRSHLQSARVVNAGPHGGQMLCGYNTSNGPAASECVWATTTTMGVVEFYNNGQPAKISGAPRFALKLRDAVEVRAQ
jgi:hypothetical protein